jgi:PAS domain S-box-containing protein
MNKKMKHFKLKDLIRRDRVQHLLKRLCASVKMGCCIANPDGEIIIEESWYCDCRDHSDFIRSLSCRLLKGAEEGHGGRIEAGLPGHVFTCSNGCSCVGVPVAINGQHLANIFVGPFRFAPTKDESEHLLKERNRKQDPENLFSYRICTHEKVQRVLAQLEFAVEVIIEMGHSHIEAQSINDALRESQIRYKALFDNSQDGLVLIEEKTIVDCNDKAVEIFQVPKDELIGESLRGLAKRFQPENRPSIVETVLRYSEQDVPQKSPVEWNFVRLDQTVVETEILIERLELPDRKLTQIVLHDVTLQHQNRRLLEIRESAWKALFQHAPFGIAINRLSDGVYLDVNPAVEKSTGRSREEIVGKPADNFHTTSQISKAREIVNTLHEQGFTEMEEAEVQRKNGTVGYALYSAATFKSGEDVNVVSMVIDITDRKKIEERLQQSEAKLQSLFQAVPVGLAIMKDRVILAANEHLTKITGYPIDRLINQNSRFLYFNDEDYEDAGKALYGEMVAGRKGYVETRFRHESGSTRFVSMFAAPLDPTTPLHGAAVAVQDITEQKSMIQALQDSEDRYRTLFEGASDSILILQDGVFVDCNQKALDLFNCRREELLGRTAADFSPERQPNGELSQKMAEQLLAAADRGKGIQFDWQHCRQDSTTFFSEVSLQKVELKDDTLMQAIVRDISEKKESEKSLRESEFRFRSFFNTNPEGILLLDFQGQILNANKAFLQKSGYTLSELRQTNLNRLICENHQDEIAKAIVDFKNGIRRDHILQTTYEAKNGKNIPVSFKGWLVTDELSAPLYLGVFIHDLTLEKSLAEEKIALEKQVIRAQKSEAIGTLASGIAHDFNNILSGIIGYTELALYRDPAALDEKTRDYLNRVFEGGTRAKDLTRQILRFSRNNNTVMEPINLTPLVEEALHLLRSTLPATITIHQNINPVSHQISGNLTQIHQVIMNLATNASHAMKSNGGTLTVNLDSCTLTGAKQFMTMTITPGEYIKITVADTGCGMTPGVLERIFDPYFTTKKIDEGTGLGMAVVLGIIKSHGGLIDIKTELGKGTVFEIYLPLCPGETEGGRSDEMKIHHGNGEKILIVDDELYFLELVYENLKTLGYNARAVQRSTEALDLIQTGPNEYDLLITDQTMPEMTGVQLIEEVRKINRTIPIILCTGFSEVVTEDSASYYGINRFLMKPVSLRELGKNVHALVNACKG